MQSGSRLARPLLAAVALLLSACSSTSVDLDDWRAREAVARPAQARGALGGDLERVESLRDGRELEASRALALALAAERPDDGRVAFLASRAESDGLVLFADREKSVRNAAAASARDYAERADALGERSVEARAQLAWALGASTHLEPMGDRAAHAARTIEVAQGVLAEDADQATALATLAVVHLRLETLPWIARVMASGLPDSSIDEAVAFARRAVEARPSRENRIVLAKCLRAAGRGAEANEMLRAALDAVPAFPRDDVLEAEVRTLLGD